ncbi:MAG: hypothetical protein LBM06_02480 [Prevotellaceae bacterium]|jgi:hypothetical protein|nr:hypothetical protein [Prevotellaceae bacterium]
MKTMKTNYWAMLLLLISTACGHRDEEQLPQAQFQLFYMCPEKSDDPDARLYQIELDGVALLTDDQGVRPFYAAPGKYGMWSEYLGSYFHTAAGSHRLKLYQQQGTSPELVYDQEVELAAGQQVVIVSDFTRPPVITPVDIPERLAQFDYAKIYSDADTIGYVKFYNFLFEAAGVPLKVVLQYQYRYLLHPIYTTFDEKAGTIPPGKFVGDPTGDTRKSKWANVGSAVAFGECTDWVEIPVKRNSTTTYTATIDYRMLVVGGTVGVEKNFDNILLCIRSGKSGYTSYGRLSESSSDAARGDYWLLHPDRFEHHLFAGIRTQSDPGTDVRPLWAN